MKNYARYLPASPLAGVWGAQVTAAGYTQVKPESPYPPLRHPLDHDFKFSHGRILHAWQLIYILNGQGRFESATTGSRKITAGTLFLLFPNVWHRYKPDPATGWIETWLELTGPAMELLQKKRVISPGRAVYKLGVRSEVVELFNQCHHLVVHRPANAAAVLAMTAMQIVARLEDGPGARLPAVGAKVGNAMIAKAEAMLAADLGSGLVMGKLAREFPTSYSYFRREFKKHLGITPKQYHLQLRLRKAQYLLANTDNPIKQIAAALGFGSPFHFSGAFKNHTGISPTRWRQKAAAVR